MSRLFVLPVLLFSVLITSAQEPKKDDLLPKPQWERLLKGEDAKKAAELTKKRENAAMKDDYETAVRASNELYELRRRHQGDDHHQVIDEKWELDAFSKVSALPAERKAEWGDALRGATQASHLEQKGNHREALPAREARLQACRTVLGELHPHTALEYDSLAFNLNAQGRFAEADVLFSKSLAIRRKTRGDEHPDTALGYNNLAYNLNAQGKYAAAEPLFKTALAIRRKVLGDEHLDTALGYANAGYNLSAQGKYSEAEPLFKKALDIRRKLLGDEHPDTALSCNHVAFILNAQGKLAEAERLFKKALAIRQKTLGEQHPTMVQMYNNVAVNLNAQGKFAEAEPLYKKALEIQQRVSGEEHLNTAIFLGNLAVNLDSQGKYAEAEPLYRKALAIHRKLHGDEHPDTAAAGDNQAVNLDHQGKHAEAEPIFKNALVIRQKTLGEGHPLTALSYDHLATNLGGRGMLAEAAALYKKALAIRCKTLGETHPDTAASYNSVAFNLQAQGKHADAEPLYERALVIRRQMLGEDHPDTAASYNNLAFNLDAQGKFVECEVLFKMALAIWQKMYGEQHATTALGWSNLAANLNRQGRQAEAEPLHLKALELRQKLLGEDHPLTALSCSNLASNLEAQGKSAEAKFLREKALAIRRKSLGEEHPDTAASLRDLGINLNGQGKYAEAELLLTKALAIDQKTLGGQHRSTAATCNELAGNFIAQGRFDESLKYLNQCRFSFEASRLSAAGRGADRASLTSAGNPYTLLSAAQARLKAPREAFAALETNLARGLLDELADRHNAGLTPDEVSNRSRLVSRLGAIEERVGALVALRRRSEQEQKSLDELLAERARLQTQLSELAVAASLRQVASLEEIQKSLKSDEAWVAWIDVVDNSGGVNEHWGCVLRAAGEPAFEPLPGTGEHGRFTKKDRDLANKFREMFRKREIGAKAEFDARAKQLYAQRLAPLEKHLIGATRLRVSGVNAMAGIPIDALTDQYTISYVPSGTFLARLNDRPRPQTNAVLALGDPIYELDKAKKAAVATPAGGLLVLHVVPGGNAERNARMQPGDVLLACAGVELKTVDDLGREIAKRAGDKSVPITIWREGAEKTLARDIEPGRLGVVFAKESAPEAIAKRRKFGELLASLNRGNEWKDLPGTRLELKTLKELFADRASILADNAASESQVDAMRQNGLIGKFRYLHFASHGEANNFQSFESALILSQNDPKAQDIPPADAPWINGRLTAREVLKFWKLDAELVTLSACQTALGRQGGGDGLLGFAQAFLLAGSRSVCLSLWEVDDRATALLMDRFYRNLLRKREGLDKPMHKAEALAEAKKWLRNLTQDEAAQRLANLTEGVARGKDQKALPIAAPKVDRNTDLKQFKPFDHPHYWAAFILIGDPS